MPITSKVRDITAPVKATDVDASSPASISEFVASQENYSAEVSDNLVSDINTVTSEINDTQVEINTTQSDINAVKSAIQLQLNL